MNIYVCVWKDRYGKRHILFDGDEFVGKTIAEIVDDIVMAGRWRFTQEEVEQLISEAEED